MFDQLQRSLSTGGESRGEALSPDKPPSLPVYLAAALFFFKQTVLTVQYTDTFTHSSSRTLNGRKAAASMYK